MNSWRIHPRTLVAIAHDASWAIGLWVALHAFLGSTGADPTSSTGILANAPVAIGIQMGCFMAFGLYRGIWRYASLNDIVRVARAVGVAAFLVPAVLQLWQPAHGLPPRAVFVLDPLLLLLFMAGGRIGYRWFNERSLYAGDSRPSTPVLLLGAGNTAVRLIDELRRSPGWRVVGLVDDDRAKLNRQVSGVKVLGDWNELAQVAAHVDARHVILAVADEDHNARQRAYRICEAAGLRLLLPPRIEDLISGRVTVTQVREVELDDLLGRDAIHLDTEGLDSLLRGRVVMVTGAGGSIGSELCRQIARFEPILLVLFELNEFALYGLEQEFARVHPRTPVRCLIGDVKDPVRLDEVLGRFRPSVVFHAAAYKHVPLMEQFNTWEAVRNNVLGTWRLAQAVERHGAEKLVFVSTDKAVNPTSVMGASKRLAEMLLQRWQSTSRVGLVIVRFGNVLGSTGSVVPKFREQIARGGPVTVTHPEIRRYFMSVPEACQLVMQAALMGDEAQVFVLDMGEPVKIVDLARDMIRLSGFTEDQIRIEFTGLRPGEKLYEELLASDETTMPTPHPKLRVARTSEALSLERETAVLAWLQQQEPPGDLEVRAGLSRFIPEYRPYIEKDGVLPLMASIGSRIA